MASIPQKELRNDVAAVLRRAEAGEELTVTVSGRPVATLGPVRSRASWVPVSELTAVWRTAAPTGLEKELEAMGGPLVDPFGP